MSKPKILLLDIEWRPTKAYVWRPWQENITPPKIIEDGGCLCVGYKWLGQRRTYVASEWKDGHVGMLEDIHDALCKADAVVTYNGDKYDLPKLSGEFLLHDLPPMPPVTSIDVIKTVRKQGYFMNRLAYIGPHLGLGSKLEHEGMALWTKVLDGDRGAMRRMVAYCRQDVVLLEELYLKVRPHMKNHPYLGKVKPGACPQCGSSSIQRRGTRRTRSYAIQRYHCQACGAWHSGERTKL